MLTPGFLHKLATICKDYYVLRTIDDLFLVAGSENSWYTAPTTASYSDRITRFNGWTEGIKKNAPLQYDSILINVANQIASSEAVPQGDRDFIVSQLKLLLAAIDKELSTSTELDIESILATVVRLLASEGRAKEVGVLANAETILKQTDYDNWDGGVYIYTLYLHVPVWLYSQVSSDKEESEKKILEHISPLLTSSPNDHIANVIISPQAMEDKDWRDKAKAWLAGNGVSNQGRVRSDNIAQRACDGLLFRSQPEINLYKALKSSGVSFAPLPVFVKGGDTYRRIEPDFVVIKDGIVLIIEVDGDTVHQETPAEAHNRTTMLVYEGAHVERIRASDCDTPEKATLSAKRLLQIVSRLKASR
jgi:hypothetical protein